MERTDHVHLGQLLTYAAGLNAVTIVWIAERFTDEHRAALDWLNQVTQESVNFFGLEVELWRIGSSPSAPKFNIVSQPNDWARTIADSATHAKTEALTETKQLQLEYWTVLKQVLASARGPIRPRQPLAQHWADFSIGRPGFLLRSTVNTVEKRVSISLIMHDAKAKVYYALLHGMKTEIEEAIGIDIEWRLLPEKKESQLSCHLWSDPRDRAQWSNQHDWLRRNLEAFHRVLSPRIKALRATDSVLE